MEKALSNDLSTISQGNRTLSVLSKKKFENVQRLTQLVQQIHGKNQGSSKTEMPQKILEIMKKKIKNNYDRLYSDYDGNKQAILKQIQQVDKNQDVSNFFNSKIDTLVKQKNQYDKIRTLTIKKQKQLERLKNLKQQIKIKGTASQQLLQAVKQRYNLVTLLEQHLDNQNYETNILCNMKKQRNSIKMNLKQRYSAMLKEQNAKTAKMKTIQSNNYNKSNILQRIEENLKKQQHYQMPLSLAQQLQKKLGQYQGKYSYSNLLEHQKLVQLAKNQEEKQRTDREKESVRKTKMLKQIQEKRQFQLLENHVLLKEEQQMKITRLCGLKKLIEITQDPLKSDAENLEIVQNEMMALISKAKQQQKQLQEEIQQYLTLQQQQTNENNPNKLNLHEIEGQLEQEETLLRRLRTFSKKRQDLLQQWQSCLQFIVPTQCNKNNMASKLQQLIPSIQKIYLKYKVASQIQQKNSNKFIKIPLDKIVSRNQQQQHESIDI